MKKLVIVLVAYGLLSQALAYNKLSLVERYTNCSCVPCANINNAWYTSTVATMLSQGEITHIVYNVDWPSPTDPMHLLNSTDNNIRRGYYGVNSVPWIDVNGADISAALSSLNTAVNNGNAEYSPFNIKIFRYYSAFICKYSNF